MEHRKLRLVALPFETGSAPNIFYVFVMNISCSLVSVYGSSDLRYRVMEQLGSGILRLGITGFGNFRPCFPESNCSNICTEKPG